MKRHSRELLTKTKYESPTLSVILVVVESGIAAASATVTPINPNNQVQDEWETGTDATRDLVW